MEMQRRGSGLENLARICARRRWALALTFSCCLTASLTAAAALPALYRSTATILVGQREPETAGRPIVPDDLDKRLQTISQEILSRERLSALIDRFGLYSRLKARLPEESLIATMRRDIQLEFKGGRGAGTAIPTIALTVQYQSHDPRLAAAVAGALATSYIEENSNLRDRETSETARALKTQLDEVRSRQEEQERRIREFKLRHSGELPQQVEANLSTMERLSTQLGLNGDSLNRALERRHTLLRDLADAQQKGVPGAMTPEAQLARLQQQLIELQTRYSDKYPDVIRTKEEIAALQKKIGQGRGGRAPEWSGGADGASSVRSLTDEIAATDAEVRRLKAEDARLRSSIAAYQSNVDGAPGLEQEFKELSRDYETTKDLYASVLKRYEEAMLALQIEQNHQQQQFRLLEPALPPVLPAAPDRLRLALAGLMVSLAAAAAVAFLAEQLDTTFHDVDDLRAFTRIPVLGSVPTIRTPLDVWRRRARAAVSLTAALLLLATVAGATWSVTSGNEEIAKLVSRGGIS